MGWLSLRQRERAPVLGEHQRPHCITNLKSSSEHVENVESGPPISIRLPPHISVTDEQYPFQDVTVPDESLPFIPPNIVQSQRSAKRNQHRRIWIVIDGIVYDCTNFIHEHPGGDTVIRSFIGEDSSWQFWRFHSRSIMENSGRPLRIGRTEGIQNRFKEPPRYVTSSKSRWHR